MKKRKIFTWSFTEIDKWFYWWVCTSRWKFCEHQNVVELFFEKCRRTFWLWNRILWIFCLKCLRFFRFIVQDSPGIDTIMNDNIINSNCVKNEQKRLGFWKKWWLWQKKDEMSRSVRSNHVLQLLESYAVTK